MEHKITSGLSDQLLKKWINSMPVEKAPEKIKGQIISRIATSHLVKPVRYQPPVLIKIGIPLLFLTCLIVLFLQSGFPSGLRNSLTHPVSFSWIKQINLWLKGLPQEVTLPQLSMPGNWIVILGSGLILFWSFFFLYRILSRTDHSATSSSTLP